MEEFIRPRAESWVSRVTEVIFQPFLGFRCLFNIPHP
jgi:hypothetical protein